MLRKNEDAGRNVLYPPCCSFIAACRNFIPIGKVWKDNLFKFGNAIGMSWFHDGADKLVKMMIKDTKVKSYHDL